MLLKQGDGGLKQGYEKGEVIKKKGEGIKEKGEEIKEKGEEIKEKGEGIKEKIEPQFLIIKIKKLQLFK